MNTWKIVLVPRPLTPLAAFVYFLLKNVTFGGSTLLGRRFFCKWTEVCDSEARIVSISEMVINLSASDKSLRNFADRLISSPLHGLDPYLLKRLKEFVNHAEKIKPFADWIRDESLRRNPESLLEQVAILLYGPFATKKDAWSMGIHLPFKGSYGSRLAISVPDQIIKTLPVIKKNFVIGQTREAVDYSLKTLQEGKAMQLCNEKIGICIGGEPNSNKSTIAAALYIELTNLIVSLKSRGGPWKDLDVKVAITPLDLSTPVTDSVIFRHGRDRLELQEVLVAQKVPWSMDLAGKAVTAMADALDHSNIVIGDLPGKITQITEALTTHCNFGIITWKERNALSEWRDFFRSMGIPVICEVKSKLDIASMVTTYAPSEKITGRIRAMDRVAGCWDSFVATYAAFLLYDILPTRVHSFEEKLRKGDYK